MPGLAYTMAGHYWPLGGWGQWMVTTMCAIQMQTIIPLFPNRVFTGARGIVFSRC